MPAPFSGGVGIGAPNADPWAKYPTQDPTAPKPPTPPRDYHNASWGDVGASALKRLVPTYVGDMWQSVKGLATQAVKPIKASDYASASEPVTMNLIRAVLDKTLGTHTYAPQVSAGDALGQVNDYLYNRYTAPGALKETLATDPGGALMDAQSVATALEGGEALTGGRAISTLNRVTNPVGLAARGVSGAAKLAQGAIRGGAALDKTGAFTPAALSAVKAAFPNGEITDAELADPRFKPILAQTLQTKGINPAAVREAVLTYNGAPTPSSVVTGAKVPSAVADPVKSAVADGRRAIAAKAQTIAGGSPDPSALGDAVTSAYDAAKANTSALYKTAFANPGTVQPVFKDVLNANLSDALAKGSFPTTADGLGKFSSYTNGQTAFDFLNSHIPTLADANDLTFPNLERARQELTDLQSGAKGTDKALVGTMRGAFDKSVNDTLSYGFLDGGDPDHAAQDFDDARNSHAALKSNFENANTANPFIRGALKAAGSPDVDISGAAINDDEAGDSAAAQGTLRKGFFPPATLSVKPTAGKLYGDLSNVLGPDGQQALDDHIRQTALATGDDGGLKAKPGQLRAFIDSPLGGVFTPQEQSDIRLMAAGSDVLDGKMTFGQPPGLLATAGKAIRAGTVAGMGAGAAHMLGLNAPIELMGAAGLGGGAEQMFEPYFQARREAQQMRGAPDAAAFLNAPQAAGNAAQTIAPLLPIARPRDTGDAPKDAPPITRPLALPSQDLSTLPGPYDAPSPPPPSDTNGVDPWAKYQSAPANSVAQSDPDLSSIPGPYDQPSGQASGGRIERASGGKVSDIEPLVQRLMARAKQAKRGANKATEPLLSVPDSAVARALDVAQRAI